jgi:hypothetical protein
MRFEILIYNNAECETAIEGALREEFGEAHQAVIAELRASGELIESNELATDDAVVVRADPDAPHRIRTTDGPFSEAKEWVGGFYTVDCADRERAVEIAGRFVEARFSPVEVRRLVHA